ncbi:hypothetical protein EZS27_015076 [termite gut metagenome]|uniref:Uncharacterized protein n=1 Tax=termite gut metagenome TaxID=433724 RepID=A0A5J4RST1_9ZZZZ
MEFFADKNTSCYCPLTIKSATIGGHYGMRNGYPLFQESYLKHRMFPVISHSHFTKLNDVLTVTQPDKRTVADSLRHLTPRKKPAVFPGFLCMEKSNNAQIKPEITARLRADKRG